MKELEKKIVQGGWITPQQLSRAQEEQVKTRKTIWAMLVKLGFLSLDDLAVFFAQESNIPYVRISDYKISLSVLRLVDENFCRQNQVIPLFKIKDTLFVACSNPLDTALLNNLANLCGCNIEPAFASGCSIMRALDELYGMEDKAFEFENFIVGQKPLEGLAFWRESERIPLNIPVSIKIADASVDLSFSAPIDGHSRDISRNGTAVALEVFLFLPKGLKISLDFKPPPALSIFGQIIKVVGEVIYCRMEKGQHYFLGIRFTEITEEARVQLFNLANLK